VTAFRSQRRQLRASEIAESGSRPRDLRHQPSSFYPKLRRALPARKSHLDRVYTRCPPSAREAQSVERGLARDAVTLVPWNEGNARKEGRVAFRFASVSRDAWARAEGTPYRGLGRRGFPTRRFLRFRETVSHRPFSAPSDRLLVGCNHDSKSRAPAHHPVISLCGAFQREDLSQGTNAGKSTEGKCVL
jgi:hypothetical protein